MSYTACISSHLSFMTFLWNIQMLQMRKMKHRELKLRDRNQAFGLNFILFCCGDLKIPLDVFALSSLLLSLILYCLISYMFTCNIFAPFRHLTLYYVVYLSAKGHRVRKWLSSAWPKIWVTSKSMLFTVMLYFCGWQKKVCCMVTQKGW